MSARPETRTPPRGTRESPRVREALAGPGLPLDRRQGVGREFSTSLRWPIADAALAIGLLVALAIVGNLGHMSRGLPAFLAMRVSVKSAFFITAFAWAWPCVLDACGLYAPNRLRTGQEEWVRLAWAGAIGGVLALIFPLTSNSEVLTPWHALLFGVGVVPAAGLLRLSARAAMRKRWRTRPLQVVLVGSGPLAARLYRQLRSDPFQNVTVLGFVDSDPHPELLVTGVTHLGGIEDLEYLLMHHVVDDVVIGLPVKSRYEEIRESLEACARVGVAASYSADLFGGNGGDASFAGHAGAAVAISDMPSPNRLAVKRTIDVVVAALLVVLLAPVFVAVAIAIKLTSRGPVLFTQYRYGYMKRLFRMYKFRTMVTGAEHIQQQLEECNEASGPVFKIRKDPRITRMGRFLRRSSLDEFPQLWNVLRGDMSLVGPRPMATRDVGRFTEPWLMRRFSVQPGITCLWQISGRSNLSFDQWIDLDLDYIDRWSLWLDLSILVRTIPVVIRGVGAM